MKKKIFVVCVDRDDDLGQKTKIRGPVIGKENNLIAAQKLILSDPTESDANTMFAGIKKFEEASKEFKNVEIVQTKEILLSRALLLKHISPEEAKAGLNYNFGIYSITVKGKK